MTTFRIYVRNRELQRVGLLEDYQRASFIPRFNAVGTWSITLDRRLPLAVELTTPGAGIELVRSSDGNTVLSGPVNYRHPQRAENTNTVTVNGFDDNVWLARRLAHPQPGTAAPPYSGAEYDVRTNTASVVLDQYVDINLGPGALAPRRVPGLTVPAVDVAGTSVTGRARWQVLLELMQGLALAGGGIGFRIRQSGSHLEFRCYQPADLTASVIFSEALGNLSAFDYESTAPEGNYLFVGGGGEGTARTVREGQDSASVATWGRIEKFIDRRDTTVTSELDQEIAKQLPEVGERAAFKATPVDTTGMSYGLHYDLGDEVTAIVDEAITELIREVQITLTPEGPQRIQPIIGTPGNQDVFRLFRAYRLLNTRLINVERR
ncbi:siphovirus ReqiPepy6 Gp37-like family protein [Allokutzneria sp. A3M-2-11 16]|uniref:siphovirus ReqiPepy6 Gp37-like family protein n=1 Tax=Allokutzneria sp. A3M-2-11 16 TaxID=2962043 RepID=UPI0020B68437|nr:siphovirus ReqiPepy6 Gp37-like family protein [Allokutzneria sp. A3M-2-11 16]MCP3805369.1 siphovirus ReqiPepy6 Gp37-like family protein [Allokutzneria sp. A3M-2-11 16]